MSVFWNAFLSEMEHAASEDNIFKKYFFHKASSSPDEVDGSDVKKIK